MDIFEIVVNFLLLIAAVILVIVVLAQDSKNAGLGSAFGSETTTLNSRRDKKVSRERQLQKLTVIFAIIVAVLAVLMLLMPAFEKWFTPKSTSAMLSAVRNIF